MARERFDNSFFSLTAALLCGVVFAGCSGGGSGGGPSTGGGGLSSVLGGSGGASTNTAGTSGLSNAGGSSATTAAGSQGTLTLDAVTSQLAQVGQSLAIDLDATGATGPLSFALTYDTVVDGVVGSGTNITALTGFTLNAATGLLNCTPTAGQIGVIEVLVTVTDGTQVATLVFNLTISNSSWTIAPVPNLRVPVGSDLSLDFALLPGLGDLTPSGGPVVYTLVYDNLPDGAVLLGTGLTNLVGATLSLSTGLLNWTPQGSQAGAYEFLLTAVSGLTTRSYIFTLEVDHKPELAVMGPYQVAPFIPFQLDLSDTHSGNDTDLDGQALTYSIRYDQTLDDSVLASAAPVTSLGVAFDPATGIVSWTPTALDAGEYELLIEVSDGSLSDSQIVQLRVADTVVSYALLGGFDAGFNPLNTIQEAPLVAEMVPPGSVFPTSLGHFAAASFKEKFFVIGGSSDAAAQTNNSRDVYSSEEGRFWTKHEDALPSGRSFIDAVAFDDGSGVKLYVFGGQYWNGITHLRLDEVLVSSDGVNWSVHPTRMPEAISGISAKVFNGRIWLVGGRDGLTASTRVYSFDGSTFRDSAHASVGDLPVGVDTGALVAHKGKLVLLGGQTTLNVPLATIYTSADGSSWQLELTFLPVARSHGVAVSDGQRVWFCGGSNGLNAQGERFYSSDGVNFKTYGTDLTQATYAGRLIRHEYGAD